MSRVFAVFGGILFMGSLIYFTFSFGWRFADEIAWSDHARTAIVIDVGLFSLFALHHSLFARTPLKAWITRICPPELERSVYVWIASALFIIICAAWQPVPGVLWHVSGFPSLLLRAGQVAGVVLTIVSARRLDAFSLAGVRQVLSPRPATSMTVLDDGPYALVRHPIYLGWLAIVWCPVTMNGTRLVFAIISCVYLLAAVEFEERDLRRSFGAPYDRYMAKVRWKIVPGVH